MREDDGPEKTYLFFDCVFSTLLILLCKVEIKSCRVQPTVGCVSVSVLCVCAEGSQRRTPPCGPHVWIDRGRRTCIRFDSPSFPCDCDCDCDWFLSSPLRLLPRTASNPLRSSSTRHPPLAWIRVEAIAIPGEGAAAAPGGQVGCRHRIIPTIPVTRFLTAQVRHQPNPPSSPLLSSPPSEYGSVSLVCFPSDSNISPLCVPACLLIPFNVFLLRDSIYYSVITTTTYSNILLWRKEGKLAPNQSINQSINHRVCCLRWWWCCLAINLFSDDKKKRDC